MKTITLRSLAPWVVAISALLGGCGEVHELKIAQQYGVSYLPMMVMEDQKLIEKHAKAAGINDLKVSWTRFKGGSEMNDAILSGNLHIASGGVAPLTTLWAKTRGNADVKAISAMNAIALYLNTRNPNVRSIKDFTEKDRIALPAVKVSIQAVTLQMAAERAFGPGKHDQLDRLTVSMSQPDGHIALLSGRSEITAHFSGPPFQNQQLRKPGIHRVLNSFDVLGGPASFNLVWTTTKFRRENPKLYQAFVDAFREAIDRVNADKRWAAETYLRVSKDKDTVENIYAMLKNPEITFTMTPHNTMKYAEFMYRTGMIKVKPGSWKDLFFPDVHSLPGS